MKVIDLAELDRSLADLAISLDATDPSLAAQVRDLGEAVQGGPSATTWAHSNLDRVLPADVIAQGLSDSSTDHEGASALELVRNTLVLLPLAITWLGIAFAVSAYRALVDAKPESAVQPFIYLWQTGFEGRTWLSLDRLAWIDGSILLVVFFLTIFISLRAVRRQNRSNLERSVFAETYTRILGQIELALAPYRSPQPYSAIARLHADTERLFDALVIESSRLDKLAEQRQAEVGSLVEYTELLDKSTAQLATAAQFLQDAHTRATSQLTGFESAIGVLQSTQAAALPALRDIGDRLQAAASQQEAQVVGLMGLVALQERHNEVLRFAGGTLEKAGRQQDEISFRLEENLIALSSLADTLSGRAESFGDVSRVLVSTQTDFLTSIAKERDAQTRLATSITRSVAGLEEALVQIKSSATNIRSIAVDLSEIQQTLPAFSDGLQRDLRVFIRDSNGAAKALSDAGNALELTAGEFGKVLREMNHPSRL